MRTIDADAFCSFLREVSTRQHYETLLTKKDRYPTVADVIEEICCDLDGTSLNGFDNAPTIDTTFRELVAYECGQKSVGKWIPVKYRPLTPEERIEFAKYFGIEYCDTVDEKAFNCPMPEDGQEILVSGSWGVSKDVADNDIDGEGFIYYGLEGNGDWEGIDAWMPLPEPYKRDGEEDDTEQIE